MNKIYLIILLTIVFAFIVIAAAPDWINGASEQNYSINEGVSFFYNLSSNITGFNNDVNFSVDTDSNLYWTNSAGKNIVSLSTISGWIKIYDVNTGNLSINATYDNQTGFFEIPIQATNITDGGATVEPFEFIINATNDAPRLSTFYKEYNLSGGDFNSVITGSDEESHYPLSFNLEFIDNCTHAEWSGRNEGENCSVMNLTSQSSTSSAFSYSYSLNDVGTYWAYLNVSDAGEQYNCPHNFCDNTTYEKNQTSETYAVKFNIFSSLEIDASNCTGQILMEDEAFTCEVNITTKGDTDNLTVTTDADFKIDPGKPPYNASWFYGTANTNSSNFKKTLYINVTPTKREVGNWTINLSVIDTTENQNDYSLIELFVNYSESSVDIAAISDLTIYENITTYINATDEDLLIRDSSIKNEQLTFASNTSWLTVTSPVSTHFLDYSTSTIHINYDQARLSGGDTNHSVKINVTDANGLHSDEVIFNVQVSNDSAPIWNQTNYSFISWEGNQTLINLTNGYTSDEENDSLTFSFSNDTLFEGLNISSSGIINFTSTDIDVGIHLVNITVTDSKLSATALFNFTIYNVNEAPTIDSLTGENITGPIIFGGSASINESDQVTLSLQIFDADLLVPSGQNNFYQENLSINATLYNLTSVLNVPAFSFLLETPAEGENPSIYVSNFTPNYLNIGTYNFTINVTDRENYSAFFYFNLTINEINDLPELENFSNQTSKINQIFYLDIDASDQEDGNDSAGNLTYTLENLTPNGNFLIINQSSGEINFSLNSSHEGQWEFLVSVNDSDGAEDSKIFKLSVYGYPNIILPEVNHVFNWSENTSTGEVPFKINYSVNNTVLTYKFYMDSINYVNSTNYSYSELLNESSIMNETNFTWTNERNFSLVYSPNFDDETYGLYKNITLLVFNPAYPELNDSLNWKVNVSHKNYNISFAGIIPDKGPITVGSNTKVILGDFFEDLDYGDPGVNQSIVFSIETVEGTGIISTGSSFNGWNLTLGSSSAVTETIKVIASEYSEGVLVGNASSNEFDVEFISPSVTPTPSPSGGGSSGSSGSAALKHFSMRIIVPKDIIISDENYIEVPFQIVNNGEVDLMGINVSNIVMYNNEFSEDIKIVMEPTYIDQLSMGEARDFNLRISANTQKSGKYKATIYANVTSPKFSDWGDFFIELKKINETAAEHVIIFTEKLIAENPECLELTELFNKAKERFEEGNFTGAVKIAEQVTDACEKVIRSNEQLKSRLNWFMDKYFYYLVFSIIFVFLLGFVFYVHRRRRFNKYESDDYIR